jgi:methylmalonyl-CoA mutase
MLQGEGQFCAAIDPWGGSHAVERLTQDIATKALAHILEIEALGGMTAAIADGLPKRRIEEAAARTQARIDSGAQTVVGVNRWRVEGDDDVPVLKVDNAAVRRGQLARLQKLRAERDPNATETALEALSRTAETGDGNLLAAALDAARAKATVGEISSALERVWGRHAAQPAVVRGVYAQEAGDDDALARAKAAVERFKTTPSSARTATTAGRRWSPPRSPTSASR